MHINSWGWGRGDWGTDESANLLLQWAEEDEALRYQRRGDGVGAFWILTANSSLP